MKYIIVETTDDGSYDKSIVLHATNSRREADREVRALRDEVDAVAIRATDRLAYWASLLPYMQWDVRSDGVADLVGDYPHVDIDDIRQAFRKISYASDDFRFVARKRRYSDYVA